MLQARIRIAVLLAIVSWLSAGQSYADSAMCLYFYRPLSGLKNFTQTSTPPNSFLSKILRDVLVKHVSAREITPQMTVEAFSNFLDLIDPMKILLSKEDLNKIGYPTPSLYGEIQYNLVMNGQVSPPHEFLLRQVNDRLDAYVRKFVHNEVFRDIVIERAKIIMKTGLTFPSDRPFGKKEIEGRVVDFLAVQMIRVTQTIQKTYSPNFEKSDLGPFLRTMREKIEATHQDLAANNIEKLVAKSYLNTFDRHTDVFLSREQKQNTTFQGNGSKTKFGTVSQLSREGFRISNIIKGSAADKAGLLENDILVAYEVGFNSGLWKSYRNLTLEEYGNSLNGEPGTQLRVRVQRNNSEFETIVTREVMSYSKFNVPTPEIRNSPSGPMLGIKLTEFSKDAAAIIKEEISRNLSNNLKGILLDLRGNRGGLTTELSDLLQLFVSRPNSMYTKSGGQVTVHRPNILDWAIWDGPLVILVDQGSASAAEALSAALKSYKRAVVIGGPHTYGKGSMQEYATIGDTTYKYTTTFYYSPNGLPIQWRGVEADIPLPITHRQPLERDERNSLNPKPLASGIPHASPIITNLEAITAVLKAKSTERLNRQNIGKTPQEIYSQNYEEAYRILADWVEIDPTGNGGW